MVGAGQYLVAVGGTLALAALTHRYLGTYPAARLPTADGRRELLEVAALVGGYLALTTYAALAYRGHLPAPAFVSVPGRTLNPAVVAGGVVLAVAVPLALEVGVRGRSLSELGFRWPRTWQPTAALLGVGVGQGLSGLWTGDAAVVSPLVLAFAVYNPALEEELFFHGIVQSKLERAVGQQRAWVASGLLFGLAHAPNDLLGAGLATTGGDPVGAALLLARQTAFGLFVGVCYAKSRSLLAPVLAHYLTNDLADLLVTAGDLLG